MKGTIGYIVAAVAAVLLCWGAPMVSQAQARSVTALEGVGYNTSASMADNLKPLVGKDVIVHLRSGKTLQGYVKSVGDGLVHLEKLAGREFYDALVRIDDIGAIEVKFRDMK
ncbi:MAG TPA: hypothetical protein PLR71_05560 [Deltaproteobacteria bacterium]|nr:hypothetical protein [Deltaproteobacteria bacterium]